ncbi:hypothetical protein [Couchioplanes caeruleus]|nr:hypothetical protein [Couchioplanes caeruleus]
MRTLQIDRPTSPSLAALYADDQAVDPIAKPPWYSPTSSTGTYLVEIT